MSDEADRDGSHRDGSRRDGSHRDGSHRDGDGFCDLEDYAAIGDGRTVALIARDARIDWLPLPDVDSAPVFAAVLDPVNGGFIALQPDEPFTSTRSYVENTNVLQTEFTCASGRVRVTDSLNTGVAGRLPWAELGRRVEGIEGSVRMLGEVRPGTCLNTASPYVADTDAGAVLRVDHVTLAVREFGAEKIEVGDDRIRLGYTTSPGRRQLLGVVATHREPLYLPKPEDIDAGIDRTIDNWRSWSNVFDWQGRWGEHVRRSALALKLLLFAPSGAVVAAATTSLPENRVGGKNWDYRYAWVRDSAYALTALFRFGLREETHGAISWLLAVVRDHGPEPRVFYRVDGSEPPDPVERDVPGWRGVSPVLSGNQARGQLQLGVYGDLFAIVSLYVDHGNLLDTGTGRTLAAIADLACDRWRSKDSGMWELPETQHYTTSKLGCWQALTKAVALAEIGQIPGDPSRWRSEADHIRDWVETNCWSERQGAYVWYPGTDKLDASILLHAISGFDRGARMSSTLDALRRDLGAGPHLYRFSGAAEEEGAFVACGFWMVSALQLVGRHEEAEILMEQLLETPNEVGMLAEMIDPADGSFLGNLPQALSHLALINAAITVSDDAGPAD